MSIALKTHLEDDVQALFNSLLDMQISTKTVKTPKLPAPRVVTAIYGSEGKAEVLCILDLALANSLSAALARVPPYAAEEAIKAGKFSDDLTENLQEIFNICTSLVRPNRRTRLKLEGVVYEMGKLPTSAKELLESDNVATLEVDVDGYPKGKLTVVSYFF